MLHSNRNFFKTSGFIPKYGAGHSGEGGGYYNISSSKYVRGAAYDDFKGPSMPGSGGDTTAGGGVIKIDASGTIEIQGEINAEYEHFGQPFEFLPHLTTLLSW